jgi:23S rRNA (guanosine2251-2'-O)-methyltransferase
MEFLKEELQILKSCYDLMRDMEKSYDSSGFQEKDLFRLAGLLKLFTTSPNRDLEKLSMIPEHLHPQMSLRHFLNFLVPIERLAGRNLSDDAFLISSEDRRSPVAQKAPLYFVLENIRSAFNVGSIFRLADCLGVRKIYLCGYTPTPDQEALKKTSLGTLESTEWTHKNSLQEAFKELKELGIPCFALETSSLSVPLPDIQFPSPAALFVGNERFGLENSTLEQCQQVIHIPTYGIKNSLNVSNALSMAAYEWRRQWK